MVDPTIQGAEMIGLFVNLLPVLCAVGNTVRGILSALGTVSVTIGGSIGL
jgi:hypothetical protein